MDKIINGVKIKMGFVCFDCGKKSENQKQFITVRGYKGPDVLKCSCGGDVVLTNIDANYTAQKQIIKTVVPVPGQNYVVLILETPQGDFLRRLPLNEIETATINEIKD